jgi:hypothetical protein
MLTNCNITLLARVANRGQAVAGCSRQCVLQLYTTVAHATTRKLIERLCKFLYRKVELCTTVRNVLSDVATYRDELPS